MLSSVAGTAAKGMIDIAGQAFAEALAKLAAVTLTFWTDVSIPDFSRNDSPVAFIRDKVNWITAFILVISLVIAGGKMVITQKSEPGYDAAKGLWTFALYSGAGIAAVTALGQGGDEFSKWIIDKSADGDVGTRLAQIFTLSALTPIGVALVLIVAILGILSSLCQMMLMVVRVGMMALLAAMLPMSAAAAVSKGGKAWFAKTLGWLLAFAAFKPAAAIIYATAFALVGKGQDTVSILSGLFLIALSVVALPALLRLTVPITAAVAAGAAGGAVAGAGAVATGAIQISAMRGGGSSGGGKGGSSGDSGPSGAPSPPGGKGPGGASAGGGGAATGASGTGGTAGGAAAVGRGAAAGAAAGGPVGAGIAAGAQVMQGMRQMGKGAASNASGDRGGGPTGASEEGQQ